jgi:hypothetical protein
MLTSPIEAGTYIPDLLRARPRLRPVLDRYGLRGCGGPLGPAETLEFFARAHEVPLPRLLDELESAEDRAPDEKAGAGVGDQIYRPYFTAAVLLVLTLGATWGAYLLLQIGQAGSFKAASLHMVNAHGHAQIFGWVGLFVMGFAYQAFPRFKHTHLVAGWLALVVLAMMLLGIVTRAVCEPLADSWRYAAPAAVAAAWVEVTAILLFVGQVIATGWRAGRSLAFYDGYILCALLWFVAQAVYEAIYLAATFGAADRAGLIALVATWQGALREMQIHGFAGLMILGVSQRAFHPFFGLPEPSKRLSRVVLVLWNAAVVAQVLGLILMRTAGHAWAGLWYLGVLVLAGCAVALVRDWRIFSPTAEPDRSLKFLRAAYVWLLVSLGMAVLLPAYQRAVLPALAPASEAATLGFSHAYYGAARHAVTVGFVSLMIVGMAARIVPTLCGVDPRTLRPLWLPFVLLNLGCTLRVLFQALTDIVPTAAFPVASVSGTLEVAGLAIWAAHLGAIMFGRRVATTATGPAAYDPAGPIEAHHRVGDVLAARPELLPTFLALGFRPLANPVLRRLFAGTVSIAEACRHVGTPVSVAVARLNTAAESPGGRVRLSVLDD